jgi:hypothetical protein
MRHWATIELKRWLKALQNDGKYSDNLRHPLLKLLDEDLESTFILVSSSEAKMLRRKPTQPLTVQL